MSVLVAVHRVFTASCEIFGYSVGAQWSWLRPSCSTTWGILIPWTGIEPTFPHTSRWICNHWTTGKSLLIAFLVLFILSRGTAFLFLNLATLSLDCDMWDLVPRPGIKPGPPTLGAWSLATGPPGKPPDGFFRSSGFSAHSVPRVLGYLSPGCLCGLPVPGFLCSHVDWQDHPSPESLALSPGCS